jgi:hypothetical protein
MADSGLPHWSGLSLNSSRNLEETDLIIIDKVCAVLIAFFAQNQPPMQNTIRYYHRRHRRYLMVIQQ